MKIFKGNKKWLILPSTLSLLLLTLVFTNVKVFALSTDPWTIEKTTDKLKFYQGTATTIPLTINQNPAIPALDVIGSVRSTAGVVATGYNAAGWSGVNAEVGVSGGNAYFTGYNRPSSGYVNTYIRGSNIYLQNNGVTHATLDTNGNFRVTGCVIGGNAPLGACASDNRLKKNINPLNVGLKQIIGLSPVTYQYNGLGDTIDDGSIQNGLIAQDVEKVAPELVSSTSVKLYPNDATTTQIKTVNYGALNFAYINAIKEQQKEIEALSDIVKKQQAEIDSLKTKTDSLDI